MSAMAAPMIAGTRSRTCLQQAILFADLCGFTEYTCRYGDELAADLALSFQERARALAFEEGCQVVKTIGDAVMVHSRDCRRALGFGWRILALSQLEGYPPVRAGMDIGPAVECEGDWYGATVNTAARIADAAQPGELVVTDRARAAVAGGGDVVLVGRGTWQLKGLPGVQVHAAAVAVA